MVFEYRDSAPAATIEAVGASRCIFCDGKLTDVSLSTEKQVFQPRRTESRFSDRGIPPDPGPSSSEIDADARICEMCGWWVVTVQRRTSYWRHGHPANDYSLDGAAGCLKALDLSDISLPIETVRDYITAKHISRFSVHAKNFEAVVGSVFRDHGYEVLVTNFSGDDGVDVILNKGAETIGVQVKRYKDAIDVGQIRELAGALILGGHTRGIFVTTSTFQKGAKRTVQGFAMRGLQIDLMDGTRFLEALGIAQRSKKKNRGHDVDELRGYLKYAHSLEHETKIHKELP